MCLPEIVKGDWSVILLAWQLQSFLFYLFEMVNNLIIMLSLYFCCKSLHPVSSLKKRKISIKVPRFTCIKNLMSWIYEYFFFFCILCICMWYLLQGYGLKPPRSHIHSHTSWKCSEVLLFTIFILNCLLMVWSGYDILFFIHMDNQTSKHFLLIRPTLTPNDLHLCWVYNFNS